MINTNDSTQKSNGIQFNVNEKVYPVSVIMKTCYLFTDKYYVYLDYTEEHVIKVDLKAKEETQLQNRNVSGEFHNELLNQALRLKVSHETKNLRELIFARALHSASFETTSNIEIIDQNLELTDQNPYEEDYLKIAESWFNNQEVIANDFET